MVEGVSVTTGNKRVGQCQKPRGLLGRFVLANMNSRHSKVTDWGLSHVAVQKQDIVLDVGCGGGRTVSKLAAMASEGKVFGIDYSPDAVGVARKVNKEWIDKGRVEIREASVSQLPFADDTFDLITGVETHFWWPALPADMREVHRVLKPGGTLVLVAEIYKGAKSMTAVIAEKYLPLSGMTLLSADEHRELLANADCEDVQVFEISNKGWICAIGRKASSRN